MNQFSVFIKEKLKLENLTNIDFLAKLNLYHQDFSELDAVTLSRWINGRSTPSLRRQLLICEFFKYDRLKFIDTAVSFKLSNSIKDHIRNHYEKMENSGFNQSSGVVAKRYFCIDNMSFSEYVNRFRGQFPEVLIDIYEHDATFSDNMITVVHNMSKDNLYHYSFASYMNLDSSIAMVINKKPEFFAKNVIFLPLARFSSIKRIKISTEFCLEMLLESAIYSIALL